MRDDADAWLEPVALIRQEVAEEARFEAWDLLEVERQRMALVELIGAGARLTLRSGTTLGIEAVSERLVDAVVVESSRELTWLRAACVDSVARPVQRLADDGGTRRTSGAWLREQSGRFVWVEMRSGRCCRGILQGVGRDFLLIGQGQQAEAIALPAIDVLRLAPGHATGGPRASLP